MLPGLRFLFAATVLSISVLIFGMGAAALLRAAHHEFAHMPTRKPLPEPVFAQPAEPSPPVLALLRVEPAALEEVSEEAASAPLPPDAAEQTDAEKLAALQSSEMTAAQEQNVEATASAAPLASESNQNEAPAPSAAEDPSIAAELAAVSDAAPAISAAAISELSTPPASPQIGEPAVRLATAGQLAPVIEPPPSTKPAEAKPANVKPKRKAARKRVQAHRAKKQRQVAQPSRQPAAVQQPANPFAALTLTPRPTR